jgi:predicted transcriptional regulator
MTLAELSQQLGLKPLTELHDAEVQGAFVSDMVSDVMAGAKPGSLWITTQTHKNIVATANLVDIAAVVVTSGRAVADGVVEMANRVDLTILTTDLDTYGLVGRLHEAGV